MSFHIHAQRLRTDLIVDKSKIRVYHYRLRFFFSFLGLFDSFVPFFPVLSSFTFLDQTSIPITKNLVPDPTSYQPRSLCLSVSIDYTLLVRTNFLCSILHPEIQSPFSTYTSLLLSPSLPPSHRFPKTRPALFSFLTVVGATAFLVVFVVTSDVVVSFIVVAVVVRRSKIVGRMELFCDGMLSLSYLFELSQALFACKA